MDVKNMTQEKLVTTEEELLDIIKRVTVRKDSVINFKWEFKHETVRSGKFYSPVQGEEHLVGSEVAGWFVHVEFERNDIITHKPGKGQGRKEFIATGTTESGVVKTCWLLMELIVRHELMEGFMYKGNQIFNPHHTVGELIEVCQKRKQTKESL
jgi:hypothetical protein